MYEILNISLSLYLHPTVLNVLLYTFPTQMSWDSLCSTPTLYLKFLPSSRYLTCRTCRGFCSCNILCLTFSSYATAGHSQPSFRGLQCIYQYNGEITICHTYQMTLYPYSISTVVLAPLCSVCLLEMVQVSNAWVGPIEAWEYNIKENLLLIC